VNHYFSRELVSLYWYGKSGTKDVANLVTCAKGLASTNMSNTDIGEHLRCKHYLSLPQLMAFDFYMAVRTEIEGIARKMTIINKSCNAIKNLPKGGWELDEFKATVIKPIRSSDVYVIYGTAYEITTITPTKDKITRIFKYRGNTLTKKIKRIVGNKVTFGQRFGDDVFWSVRSYQERRGWRRWRRPVGMINKKSLKILDE